MRARMQKRLEDPALPERLRAVENWPPAMREQWGRDRGEAHCGQHRRDLIDQFRRIRAELDDFRPDFEIAIVERQVGATQGAYELLLAVWSRHLASPFTSEQGTAAHSADCRLGLVFATTEDASKHRHPRVRAAHKGPKTAARGHIISDTPSERHSSRRGRAELPSGLQRTQRLHHPRLVLG